MRADGLPDDRSVMDRLAKARDAHQAIMPGKPAMNVPVEALHFFKDENGALECVIDMDEVVSLAEQLLRSDLSGD